MPADSDQTSARTEFPPGPRSFPGPGGVSQSTSGSSGSSTENTLAKFASGLPHRPEYEPPRRRKPAEQRLPGLIGADQKRNQSGPARDQIFARNDQGQNHRSWNGADDGYIHRPQFWSSHFTARAGSQGRCESMLAAFLSMIARMPPGRSTREISRSVRSFASSVRCSKQLNRNHAVERARRQRQLSRAGSHAVEATTAPSIARDESTPTTLAPPPPQAHPRTDPCRTPGREFARRSRDRTTQAAEPGENHRPPARA